MYRTNDPRFRRRLTEIGQTLESANETAQSGIYIFGQNYIKPCFDSVGNCFATCIDAGCPSLNIRNRDRLRRQRGRARSRGRAELNFDFYDDWDEEENEGLLGWGNDEFDRLLAGSTGYGTVTSQTGQQPGRQRGMSYPKARRKSAHGEGPDTSIVPGTTFFGKLFGGKALRYKPSAADLQDHPGARRLDKDFSEGEALLEESEASEGDHIARRDRHKRKRSGTATSGASRDTQDSYSSRGDIFPSDDEDDAVPLDDEFAMVLERRTTQSGPDTESNASVKTPGSKKRGKRPSTGSRLSSRRTVSSRSMRSLSVRQSRSSIANSSAAQTPIDEAGRMPGEEEDLDDDDDDAQEVEPPSLNDLQIEERRLEEAEEDAVQRKRDEALRLAEERGLAGTSSSSHVGKDAASTDEEPSQLPTPSPTDDEDEAKAVAAVSSSASGAASDETSHDDERRHSVSSHGSAMK